MSSVVAYPPPWRLIAALLAVVSIAALLGTLLLVLGLSEPPLTLAGLLVLLGGGALLPALGVVAVRRACAMAISVEAETLALRRKGLQIDIPHAAIVRFLPWRLPLPEPGLWIVLRSGRRLRYGLGFPGDPAPLLRALADAGVDAAAAALAHPTMVYASARPVRRRPWLGWIGKFGLFSLIPAAILFNAHQWIAYGGTFGEYYLLGAASWARTGFIHWLTVALYLVLFAAALRSVVELGALASAWLVPTRAASVRRLAEPAASIAYYGGALALLALRFYA